MNVTDAFAFWAGQEGYLLANTDASAPGYNGYENKNGAWYIQKETISGNVTTYTYAKGASDYAAAWTARASQTYAAPSTTFK